ncbi:MAG: hypothetical protein AAGJ35_06780, partial [Myxococcota bacterium]
KSEEARSFLKEIAPQALDAGIQNLPQFGEKLALDKQKVEALFDIAQNAPPEKQQQAFEQLFYRMKEGELQDLQVDIVLEMARNVVPEMLADYLQDRLKQEISVQERETLLHQAIALDTAELQEFLGYALKGRCFSHQPEQEELILQYLHRKQNLEASSWLCQEIDTPDNPSCFKHSAIWMLGLFHQPKVLEILRNILFSKQKKAFAYTDDLRFQAAFTLTRFPRPQVLNLFEQLQRDPFALLRTFAQDIVDNTSDADKKQAKRITSRKSLQKAGQVLFKHLWFQYSLLLILVLIFSALLAYMSFSS